MRVMQPDTTFRLPPDEATLSLQSLSDLFNELNQQGIRYCHWKSNLRLEKSLNGQTDLDLLVDQAHKDRFKDLLKNHRVELVQAPPGKDYPGTENYLGFDPVSGKLFHLHVHYKLVLGEQFVKNYHIPLENQFLNSDLFHHGVKIPTSPLELIILSIRALLKYRDRDVIKDILSVRTSGIPTEILAEIHWLLDRTSMQEVSNELRDLSNLIPSEIIREFLQTVIVSPRSGYKFFVLRGRLRRALRNYQRTSRIRAVPNYFLEAWRRRRSLFRNQPARKMSLPAKGFSLALVGVDGSGKTTLSRELAEWLSWKLDVRPYYLGSKKPSWISQLTYLLFRLARRSHSTFSARFGENNAISRLMSSFRQVFLYAHYLSVGLDRYRRYQDGTRYAGGGSIVIYDRFPMAASLDGPRIDQISNGSRGRIARAFSRLEQQLYNRFQAPELLLCLTLSPGTSLKRKPDHQRKAIESKILALDGLAAELEKKSQQTNWVEINAELPIKEVFSQIKKEVWGYLISGCDLDHPNK
jgi:thymidylate kinase